MAKRIAGIELPNNKRICIGLTYVFGIGRSKSNQIIKKLNINPNKKVEDLREEEVKLINQLLADDDRYQVEGKLRSSLLLDLKRLMNIGCYRGIRHRIRLPVRGQKTKNNCRTRKGKRITIANKKKATK